MHSCLFRAAPGPAERSPADALAFGVEADPLRVRVGRVLIAQDGDGNRRADVFAMQRFDGEFLFPVEFKTRVPKPEEKSEQK